MTVTLTGDASGSASVNIPMNQANVREFFASGDFTNALEEGSTRSYEVSFRPVGGLAENSTLPEATTIRWSLVGSGGNPIETADFAETTGALTFSMPVPEPR